ncbi:MAG: D-alanyl-D-alanine carboxypeptidase [Candidatus Liptonbacteria bacterium]|nr:D-alanyl-D-alanine carboxypeptidase [Candidatus Liptonbacteria bacterium]
MSSFHKIFFVGVVILSVAVGNHFNGVDKASGSKDSSAIISVSYRDHQPGNPSSSETNQLSSQVQVSTTANDVQAGAEPSKPQNSNDDSKSVMYNGALLKADSLVGQGAFRQVAFENPPAIDTRAALIADLQTGKIYFAQNPTLRRPMASITKLMTAMTVLKNIDLTRPLTMEPSGVSAGDDQTLVEAFNSSGSYSGNDILTSMLLVSQNEAAETFANAYGRESFTSALNQAAAELGMNSTNFSDPTGLSVANQSSAADLQKLALKIYQDYPKILEITRKKTATITELNSQKRIKLTNINIFAGTTGFIGGKTGETKAASGNLLSIFSLEKRPVLVIVLGTEDRFGETEKLLSWFENNFKLVR